MDFGAMIFDDISTENKDGWACKSPEFEPFRANAEKFGGNTVWLTNATFEELNACGYRSRTHIKHDKYLRSSALQILGQYGLLNASPEDRAFCLAKVFFNVVQIFLKYVHPVLYRESDHYGEIQLPLDGMKDGIRHLYPYDQPVSSRAKYILEKAVVDYQICTRNFKLERRRKDEQKISVSVWPVKTLHAKEILSYLTPTSAKMNSLKVVNKGLVDPWVEDVLKEGQNSVPRLFRVQIDEVDAENSHLIALGNKPFQRKKRYADRKVTKDYSMRQWMTHIDVATLSGFCKMKVIEAYEFLDYKPLINEPVNHDFFKNMTGYKKLGLVSNLFAEILWMGVTSLHILVEDPELRRTYFNPMTPYLKSYDRMICFAYAAAAKAKYGLAASGYGAGKINFFVYEDEVGSVLDFCEDQGLLFDVKKTENRAKKTFISKQGQDVADMQSIMYNYSGKKLLEFDDVVCKKEFA